MSAAYDSFVRDGLPPAEQQPDFSFDLPELQYPAHFNAAAELLAGGAPGDLAVINAAGRWTYGDMDDLSARIARVLVEDEGLIPGNRVLLAGRNGAMLFAAWLGILKAGGVVTAIMPILRGGEIAKVVGKAEITHAIVDAPCREAYGEAAEQCDSLRSALFFDGDSGSDALSDRIAATAPGFAPVATQRDDPALIAFTSGTTGDPKGCVQFHRDILASADSFARHVIRPRTGARWACSAPLAFTFGLGMQFVFPFRFGGCAVTPSRPGPEGLAEAIGSFAVDICATAPTAYRAMLAMPEEERDFASLTTCISAGEHLPEAIWRAWHEATGVKIIDGIGATEMMHIFISASGDDIRPGATGLAVPGYRATVLDLAGQPMDEGTGRLAVKGPTGCRYLADPRQADYVQDGWNVTGDTYRRDAEGYFWFVARSDDMIISSGYNIAAPEVEQALYAHPAVAECAVIGVPCKERGQLVKAFVVAASGCAPGEALAAELQDHVKAAIAPYKYPRAVEFVSALPKTATGKLQRFALRKG
ncbi:AMP-binding protein [Qipengyuania marisflavi]|uniref:2-aminobenzoate-CoA ligase n=1 Tax=Qipengyuania marisflavi TaxID=2486356 RepID=A0A5S3P363_9SPHN|nr:AMP-binding protein [Qipengyuania marisflavi]TMM47268.1 2-aminobenzoate-CoA ligase [Qipengyuania marisflavi]